MNEEDKTRFDAEMKKRQREYVIIVMTLITVFLITFVEARLTNITEELPIANTILFFALFNIDLVLILLLIFLVTRNLVKLFVEHRRGVLGSSLKTKLVLAFTGLTLIPTGVLFFVAFKFINYSLESWFDPQINQVFVTSNEIVQSKYEDDGKETLHFAEQMQAYIEKEKLLSEGRREELKKFLHSKLEEYDLARIEVIFPDEQTNLSATSPQVSPAIASSLTPSADYVEKAMEGDAGYWITPLEQEADVIRAIVPLRRDTSEEEIVAVLVTQTLIDKSLFGQMKANERSYQDYLTLKQMKNPIKNIHITLLAITTLVILFSATWFGSHIAKNLVAPLEKLASATERVAKGDLAVTVEADASDEMGVLAASFNKMTHELVTSKNELERAYQAVEHKNIELEQRRRYMEIVLANVAAGVISLDKDGKITTINKAAQRMLRINVAEVLGRNYKEVMRPYHLAILEDLLETMARRKEGSVKQVVTLNIGGSSVVLQVTLTELKDDDGESVGMVGIFEDITQILQAQRAVAWREVARRIAHEIKNPLTPIQLSAERLRRNYAGKINGDGTVFNEATELIIKQVKELRELVDEFRNFARMPAAQPAPADLNEIAREAVGLYQEAHKRIDFELSLDPEMPIFELDRDQIKRALTNLLDNAVSAIVGRGSIKITTTYIESLQIARIEVADSGSGIKPEDRERIFEPDFSTKKGGSGLGLAIVRQIVSDHYGYIRVRDNVPRGTVFVIELPTHLPRVGARKVADASTGAGEEIKTAGRK